MYKLCRIDIEKSERIFKDLRKFSKELKKKFNCEIYLFGSFAKGEIHEGSDIDLIIIGEFKGKFHERIGKILEINKRNI